jgi:TFIIF-interacting CTD phosphatase-like protein
MKKNVFLDLDNTLISAEALTDFPFTQEGIKDKALKFRIHNMDDYYIVFERPGVQEFLTYLFQNFRVSVWTAATKDYALFIIKHILLKDPKRQLDYILFSHQCDLSRRHFKSSKDLRLVFELFRLEGYSPANTIIIDDLKEVHTAQPKNCIHLKAFEILEDNSENDDELSKVRQSLNTKFQSLSV